MKRRWMWALVLGSLLALGACDGESDDDDDDSADDDDAGDDDVAGDVCTEPKELPCEDDMILDLALHDDMVSDGEVTTTTDGDDFVTIVDATAGGYSQANNNPWVYVRFDDDGAHRVDIDDEEALYSMEWHVAARRYVIRLNGGTSGPSCVGADPQHGTSYDELTAIPDGVEYAEDEFYDDECTIINDNSGLENSPSTALSDWWEYPGCVATTDVPFLVRLENGRVIKLWIAPTTSRTRRSATRPTPPRARPAPSTPGAGSG